MKKTFLFLSLLITCFFAGKAQVKISDMPTFIGNPSGSWVPIVVSGVNRKIDGVYFGYTKLDSIYRKPGSDSLFKVINGTISFVTLMDTLSGGGGSGWSLTGNSGTIPGTNFIGTTDNNALDFETNNSLSGIIDPVNKNTGLGYLSLLVNTGSYNTALGYVSLWSNTSGINNTGIGFAGLRNNTTGGHNTAVGYGSLFMNITGNRNTAIGDSALYAETASNYKIGIGYRAGGTDTVSGKLSISDSTPKMHYRIDSLGGVAPFLIGEDANHDWHEYSAASIPSLQAVTSIGNTTTNGMIFSGVNNVYYNTPYGVVGWGYSSGDGAEAYFGNSTHSVTFSPKFIDSSYLLRMPKIHTSSYVTMPMSVNGNYSDSLGNILISADTTSIPNFSVKVRSLFAATSPITYSNGSIGMVNQGTTTTVLHGNASGNPAFSSVVSNDISGRIDSSKLFQQTIYPDNYALFGRSLDSLFFRPVNVGYDATHEIRYDTTTGIFSIGTISSSKISGGSGSLTNPQVYSTGITTGNEFQVGTSTTPLKTFIDSTGSLTIFSGQKLITSIVSLNNGGSILTSGNGQNMTVQSRGFASGAGQTFGILQLGSGTMGTSSAQAIDVSIIPTYNQTSTAGGTDLLIQRTETAVGSGQQNFVDMQVGTTSKFRVDHAGKINITTGSASPVGTSSAMSAGTITVSTTAVTSSSIIILTGISTGAPPCSTCGSLSVGTITNGTSFVINSSLSTDTRAVNWVIIN